MKLAAAHAIANVVSARELSEEYIIPSVFNRNVVRAVARDVTKAAQASGVPRRHRKRPAVFL
jgi:malate dehydrogenase (oxaloacetate-decarboxylating)